MPKVLSPPFHDITAAARTWSGPSWLKKRRADAASRFEELGLPTTRLENWRHTPLPASLSSQEFVPGFASTANFAKEVVAATVPAEDKSGAGPIVLTFVDGLHSITLSTSESQWPKGVQLSLVSRIIANVPDELEPWFQDDTPHDAFAALNDAAFRDGAFIAVHENVSLDREIWIVLASASHESAVAANVRNFVHLGPGAHAKVTVVSTGTAESRGLLNVTTTVSLGPSARLTLTRVHNSPVAVPHADRVVATLGEQAKLQETTIQVSEAWARAETDIEFAAEGSEANLSGLFLAGRDQVTDIHTTVSHSAPRCRSKQRYRGLAAQRGRGVFHGQVRVGVGAAGTDADQSNKNLLLSRDAFIHSTPALEILADDVKCKHGSTTGQVDPAQLFYLRSRGFDEASALQALTRAFAHDIVADVTPPLSRALVDRLIEPALARLGLSA